MMKDSEETTSRLEETLREIDNDKDADDFIALHREASNRSFSGYYNKYIGEHHLTTADIVENAGFGGYAYQIIDGRKNPTNRDHVLALCIAAGMTVKETDRALRLAGHYPLDPKDERDVRIVVCINKGLDKVVDVNLELDRYNIPLL